MRAKFWIGIITVVISMIIIKYYITEYEGQIDVKEDIEIRVLIKNNNFESIYHEEPVIISEGAFLVKSKDGEKVIEPGQEYVMTEEEEVELLSSDNKGFIIQDLKRNQEQPLYEGSLKLIRTSEGVVIINQILLEEYLPKVLSSEMSSAFPDEALKAQAVSARTYALKKIEDNENAYYGADLDDSVSYQVYNNVQESLETRKAVESTKGIVLIDVTENGNENKKEKLSEVYYYSTSCGVTSEDIFESEEAFRHFILSVRDSDKEKEEAWYRWKAEITLEQIEQNLSVMGYEFEGRLKSIEAKKRSKNGQVQQLELLFTDGNMEQIKGEYYIRKALDTSEGKLVLQDGKYCDTLGMLPSGWFVLDKMTEQGEVEEESAAEEIVTGYRIFGGGYGHGNGLSQNGARIMAEQGMTYKEILSFYYPDSRTTVFEK